MTPEPEEDEFLDQCECWWTTKDEFGSGERMQYADHDCPVHVKDGGDDE